MLGYCRDCCNKKFNADVDCFAICATKNIEMVLCGGCGVRTIKRAEDKNANKKNILK